MSDAISAQSEQGGQAAIRKLNERWSAAVRAKDVTGLTGMVTDDVVFLPPGFPPIRGKQAVQEMYATFFAQFAEVEQTVSIEEIEAAGDWAFAWGSEKLVLTPKGGGAAVQMEGKGMTILRRDADGSWRFARGINNSALKK
jgi:uncharacterized protein (TIGR02246 family)